MFKIKIISQIKNMKFLLYLTKFMIKIFKIYKEIFLYYVIQYIKIICVSYVNIILFLYIIYS